MRATSGTDDRQLPSLRDGPANRRPFEYTAEGHHDERSAGASKSVARLLAGVYVFVYGTLTDPARAAAVLDEWEYAGGAILDGLHCVDGEYPTLAPGGSVEGRLLRTDELAPLDVYEGVDRGLYVRVVVPVRGTLAADDRVGQTAAVYVGDPARLDAPAEWPGDGDLEERVTAYVEGNDVAVRPLPDGQG